MVTKGEKKMRVIITGGTGLIGRTLAKDLSQDGHEVIVLSRDPEKRKVSAGIKIEHWDGRSPDGWGSLVEGTDAIVNLAGERLAGASPALRWTENRRQRICQSRWNAGVAVTDAVRLAKTKPVVVIQASGIDYYATGDQIATENSPPGDDFLSHICMDYWEPSTAGAEAEGVRRAIVRIGPVIGPESHVLMPLALQHKLFLGGPMGSGKQWFSWVHLVDVIGTIRFLIDDSSASGAYNLCAPKPITNAEFSKTLGNVLGRPSFLPTPAFMLRLAFGEMSTTILNGVRAEPRRLLDAGYSFQFPDAESALRNSLS
jgi:uncharacterized protein (TIGR01777 family)